MPLVKTSHENNQNGQKLFAIIGLLLLTAKHLVNMNISCNVLDVAVHEKRAIDCFSVALILCKSNCYSYKRLRQHGKYE